MRMADVDVVKGLLNVYTKINAVCTNRGLNYKPRLVAVGKTKPKEMIIACYEQGQRAFGENYIQELVDKSTDPEVLDKCKDIKWHFIGSIQRNKVPKLVTVPNLDVVETISSEKVASAVNSAWEKLKKSDPLKVMVQVNTSREEEKGGVEVEHCSELVRYVLKSCPALKFIGLMTIGKYGYDTSEGPNPDFLALKSCRETVCNDLELQEDEVELSMGMSTDFEQAIELGSTSVRVGTTIFGYREKKEPKAVTG
uniref:Pyridoxal phosphate homeostasis protein n=1 Tax=Lygus hesperus TaxID=30085 RepID=A0A0A9WMR6_LYGHE